MSTDSSEDRLVLQGRQAQPLFIPAQFKGEAPPQRSWTAARTEAAASQPCPTGGRRGHGPPSQRAGVTSK